MHNFSFDFWIIITGILVVIPCSILGSLLTLKKSVMVADAISHAVLPGIVVSFLLVNSLSSIWLLFGASFVGLMSTVLIEFLRQKVKIQNEASIGITFTWLFAIGVILVSLFANNVDLDLDCVLFGQIEYVPLNDFIKIGGFEILPKPLIPLFFISITTTVLSVVFYKELKLSIFDEGFAKTIGLPSKFIHYGIMALLSLTCVAAFESVGAILVIAFIAVPAATSFLFSKQLSFMMILACCFGILGVISGTFASNLNGGMSSSGLIVITLGLIFVCSMLVKKVIKI